MKHHSNDNWMVYFSRTILIISVVITIISLILFADTKIKSVRTLSSPTVSNPSSPSSSPIPSSLLSSTPSQPINLTGPLICNYQSKEQSIDVWVKNKNVLVEMKKGKDLSKYLLKGECLYTWKASSWIKKRCDLSSYVTMYETLSGMGIVDISSLLSMIPSQGIDKSLLPDESTIKEVLSSCQKKEVNDQIFKISF